MKTNFSQKIFPGGILEVKQLFVNELREKLVKANITPEMLDKALNLSADWPTCQQILDNPTLFNFEFNQRIAWNEEYLSNPNNIPEDFDLVGIAVVERIHTYVSSLPAKELEKILQAQRETFKRIHISCWTEDPIKHIEDVLNGKPIKAGEVNMISATEWAETYIFIEIMHEMEEMVII